MFQAVLQNGWYKKHPFDSEFLLTFADCKGRITTASHSITHDPTHFFHGMYAFNYGSNLTAWSTEGFKTHVPPTYGSVDIYICYVLQLEQQQTVAPT